MPFHVPPVADETEALAAYVAQQQDAFRAVIFGLTDEQAGEASTPSSLTVGTLVKHAAETQQGWLETVLVAAGREAPQERSMEERMTAYEEAFTWLPHDTVADVLDRFDAVSAAVLDAVREIDLDTAVPVSDEPWHPQDVEAWSARWVWFHLIEELARHAGHADIVREAVDGATMYELMAGHEGLPETPWLKPWRPEPAES